MSPPVAPMLARLTRELPTGNVRYEPKWDGFRCLAFRDGDDVDLRSRHDRPLARYFPELVEGLLAVQPSGFVVDGEIMVLGEAHDFAKLMSRLHPAASRVARLRVETPATYIAFDLLAAGDEDLRDRPFAERRTRLEALLADAAPPILLTPITDDVETARQWFAGYAGAGVDGVVVKPVDLPYEPGRRSMIKVKHERTADCVLAGVRFAATGRMVATLLLGSYDDDGALHHVGVVTQLTDAMRTGLVDELAPLAVALEDHPWRAGFVIGASPLGRLKGSAARWRPDMEHDWVPLRPQLVCEVGFDQVDGDRFRHPARFRRWRPDRDAASCRLDQIAVHGDDVARLLRSA